MLEILPVKQINHKDDKKTKKLNPLLIKPPFLGVLNGSTRSGKSTMVTNFLYNPDFYKNIFENVIIISPTVLNDDTLRFIKEDEKITKISENFEFLDDILKTIVESQEDVEKEEREDVLIILDDMLGFLKRESYLTYLCTRYRHYKISILITTQSFRAIPNIIRTNADFVILFATQNKKEYKKIEEEYGGLIPDFETRFKEATDKPYNFMYINLKKIKVYHNFIEKLYEK